MIHVYEVQEIRAKRIQLKISQEKMANILKVSLSTYQKYERKNDMLFSQIKKCTEYINKTQELENSIMNKYK